MKRRAFLGIAAVSALGVMMTRVAAAEPAVEVYKSPTCGCCGKWADHLRANGFTVRINQVQDTTAVRARAGMPAALASCHTALVGGYVLEGHVPAADIRKLLAERPKALGLAAPGMPPGSPGMDLPHAPAWDVLLVQVGGATRVYHAYPAT